MKLNKIWGYGQLFGFSALEGPNRYYDDNILMTMKEKLSFRFEFKKFILMNFKTKEKVTFKAIMSDFVDAKIGDKDFFLTFLDNDTLVGISPVLPKFVGQEELRVTKFGKVTIYSLGLNNLGVRSEKTANGYKFIIHNSFAVTEARSGANHYFDEFDINELKQKRYEYYKKLPKCKDAKYEELYYKALAINKVNVRSPEGKIKRIWTTPDRVPHRHMWMWDTAFHCLAMVQYNKEVAKDAFLAMLETQRKNGFIPHMANPTDQSDVTQPCVMSWAAYYIYQVSKDKKFLNECVSYLDKYLMFDIKNRDKNNNGLLEWLTEPEYSNCKCGESGLDNSPRFDFDEEMDAIDFSTYFANDTMYLSKIYKILGNTKKAEKWNKVSQRTSNLINNLMLSKEDGVYYDRLFSGKLTNVLTPSSFLPMMAGFMDKKYIEKAVKKLIDKKELWCKSPLSSISQKDSRFSNDMWRGGVWININYFIIIGLLKYGKKELAENLRQETLDMIQKWYKETGSIFEFYDPNNKVSPFYCERKGKPIKEPDYRKHVHSISDYNWSASFTILLIQKVYYL